MTFGELPVGAHFRFFAGGSLLTKTGPRTYEAPQWANHVDLPTEPDNEVIPVGVPAGR